MKKTISFIKDYIFGIILAIFLFTGICVYAATTISASDLLADTTNMPNVGSDKTVQDTIEYLYNKKYCPIKYTCFILHTTPEVGDYVQMTPTLSSYTTDTTYTGYTSTQTINPKELNLWRVIKVNDNGTIEMVSENVSSTDIYFKGQTGYKNLVGYLNVLASKYENSKYTIGSRHMGYNGQTEYLTDTANTVDSTNTTAPWSSSSSGVESQGGGDSFYYSDTALVKKAVGTLVAKNNYYWLASRAYRYNKTTKWQYAARRIMYDGSITDYSLYVYNSGFSTSWNGSRIRPIVILKSGINYTPALGTNYDPFVMN